MNKEYERIQNVDDIEMILSSSESGYCLSVFLVLVFLISFACFSRIVFSDLRFPNAISSESPMVVRINHEETDMFTAIPPAKTLNMNPVETNSASKMMMFLK